MSVLQDIEVLHVENVFIEYFLKEIALLRIGSTLIVRPFVKWKFCKRWRRFLVIWMKICKIFFKKLIQNTNRRFLWNLHEKPWKMTCIMSMGIFVLPELEYIWLTLTGAPNVFYVSRDLLHLSPISIWLALIDRKFFTGDVNHDFLLI